VKIIKSFYADWLAWFINLGTLEVAPGIWTVG
jgi:hypothetical protein